MARALIPVIDSAGANYLIATKNIERVEPLPTVGRSENQRIAILVLEPVSAGADGLGVVYELNHYYSGLSLTAFLKEYA